MQTTTSPEQQPKGIKSGASSKSSRNKPSARSKDVAHYSSRDKAPRGAQTQAVVQTLKRARSKLTVETLKDRTGITRRVILALLYSLQLQGRVARFDDSSSPGGAREISFALVDGIEVLPTPVTRTMPYKPRRKKPFQDGLVAPPRPAVYTASLLQCEDIHLAPQWMAPRMPRTSLQQIGSTSRIHVFLEGVEDDGDITPPPSKGVEVRPQSGDTRRSATANAI